MYIYTYDMVENEHHSLLVCPAYDHERKQLLHTVSTKLKMSIQDLIASVHEVRKCVYSYYGKR